MIIELTQLNFKRNCQMELSLAIYDVFRGSHFCLLAFSTTDRESFENVRWWKQKVENECGLVPMVLVMNKIDLIANSVIER